MKIPFDRYGMVVLALGMTACPASPPPSIPPPPPSTTTPPSTAPVAAPIPDEPPAEDLSTIDGIEVVARLVDKGPDTALCGIVHWVVVMKYETVRNLRGAPAGTTIFVAHGCPQMDRKHYDASGNLDAFRVGDVHHLVLRESAVPKGSVVDHPERKGSPLYGAVRTNLEARAR